MSTASLTLALCLTAAPAPHPQIADHLVAGRGFGPPSALGGTDDGQFVFSAEGASIAIIEPGRGGQGQSNPDLEFDMPIKQFELGHFRPHPVRMIVDPEIDLDDGSTLATSGPDYRNYLFVAAGGNGLWIVDVDPALGTVNRVARVDDSGDVPGVQDSDRHCNDVDLVTVSGTTYVVATFAAVDDNRLRFYELDDVRGVLGCTVASPAETGNEIAPLHEIVIGAYGAGNPALEYERHPMQLEGSFASETVVDQGLIFDFRAFMYVALRTDGLVRVRVRRIDLELGVTPPGTIAWGPRFGDGSHYATVAPPAPFPDEREVYTNIEWINQQYDPDVVERSDPPYFTTLAVHRNGLDFCSEWHGHKLYVGVDALGIVVFDLLNPLAWGPTMPIDHHEGAAVDLEGGPGLLNRSAWPERVVGTADPASASTVSELLGYVRSMGITDTVNGLQLVATYSGEPSFGNSPLYLEGFAYDDQFQYGGVTYFEPMRGPRLGLTRIYDIGQFPDASPTPSVTQNTRLLAGGATLFVPRQQSNQMGAPSGEERLEFVHNVQSAIEPEEPGSMVTSPTICMISMPLTPTTPGGVLVAIRDRDFLAGRRTFGLSHSLVDPALIMTSDNDGLPREGLPYLLGPVGDRFIDVDYVATSPAGNDVRLSTGVIMGRNSQWLDSRLGPNQQAQLGAGPATHRVSVQTIPSTFLGSPPVSEYRINLLQQPSRWNQTGRAFYLGGMVDPRYDAWVQANVPGSSSAEYFFLWRQTNPDGVVYGRRDALMNLVAAGTLPNEAFLSPTQLNTAGVQLRTLNTHPEFDQFPFSPSQPNYAAAQFWFGQIVVPQPYSLRVKTWEPELVQVNPPTGSTLSEGWVLAVPCGVGVLDVAEYPDVEDVSLSVVPYTPLDDVVAAGGATGDSDWLPDAGSTDADTFRLGLVNFWDFTDPGNLPAVAGKPAGSSNLGRVALPIAADATPDPSDVGRSSFAWHLEGLEVDLQGTRHSYVIVGDFIGGVHAYEISDILRGTAPVFQDSWYPPLGLQDRLTNNIRDVVVDRDANVVHVYVAVQRIGIVVLRVDLSTTGALTLTEVARIDDVKEPLTLHLRVEPQSGERLLYVSDNRQALRVYSSL
jgi:hypothetical protein